MAKIRKAVRPIVFVICLLLVVGGAAYPWLAPQLMEGYHRRHAQQAIARDDLELAQSHLAAPEARPGARRVSSCFDVESAAAQRPLEPGRGAGPPSSVRGCSGALSGRPGEVSASCRRLVWRRFLSALARPERGSLRHA